MYSYLRHLWIYGISIGYVINVSYMGIPLRSSAVFLTPIEVKGESYTCMADSPFTLCFNVAASGHLTRWDRGQTTSFLETGELQRMLRISANLLTIVN